MELKKTYDRKGLSITYKPLRITIPDLMIYPYIYVYISIVVKTTWFWDKAYIQTN